MVEVACSREFLPKQLEVLETTKRFPLYSGAFGGGKTLLGCHKVLKECLENPGSVWLCASQSYPQLRDTLLSTFLHEVELLQGSFDAAGSGIVLVRDYNRTELRVVFFNGSIVLFRSCDDFSKFKSLTLDGFFVDEPVDISEDCYRMLQGRLRGRHGRHRFGVLAGNPSSKSCWLYKLYFEHPPSDDYLVVQTSTYDNSFLESSYVSSLEGSYDEDWKRRYLRGEWFSMEGLIYPEFSREVHVGDFVGRVFSCYHGGLDWGFRNPSCFLLFGRDGDGNLFVLKELYKSQLTAVELARCVRELVGMELSAFGVAYCDPSAPATIEELVRAGVQAVPGDNNVLAGISRVKSLLHQRRLFIDRGCVNLIHELEDYCYAKDGRGGEYSEQPVKANDHAVDSLRYGCVSGEMGTSDFYIN